MATYPGTLRRSAVKCGLSSRLLDGRLGAAVEAAVEYGSLAAFRCASDRPATGLPRQSRPPRSLHVKEGCLCRASRMLQAAVIRAFDGGEADQLPPMASVAGSQNFISQAFVGGGRAGQHELIRWAWRQGFDEWPGEFSVPPEFRPRSMGSDLAKAIRVEWHAAFLRMLEYAIPSRLKWMVAAWAWLQPAKVSGKRRRAIVGTLLGTSVRRADCDALGEEDLALIAAERVALGLPGAATPTAGWHGRNWRPILAAYHRWLGVVIEAQAKRPRGNERMPKGIRRFNIVPLYRLRRRVIPLTTTILRGLFVWAGARDVAGLAPRALWRAAVDYSGLKSAGGEADSTWRCAPTVPHFGDFSDP
jgi:hypothetical protein